MPNFQLENVNFSTLRDFRRKLHAQPELSGKEEATAKKVESFLRRSHPTTIIRQLGGQGIAFVYDSGKPGPHLGFRCELDALPIQELNSWEHRSEKTGVSHKCGHDGHMAILAGLGLWLEYTPLPRGKISLFFQPAEETGEGAHAILQDPRWPELKPEWLFGLHNIPGYPEGTIFCKEGSFCAASKGLLLKLKGTTSHAAEPEKGKNPSRALSCIMLDLQELPAKENLWKDLVLLTPVYAQLGEKAFGTSAGAAEFGATLRSFEEPDMQRLTLMVEEIIRKHCLKAALPYELDYLEVFPATVNHPMASEYVRKAAQHSGLSYTELEKSFRWSEDFGWFGKDCKTAFFGLGAGENQPALHHPDYDFPDQIITPGVRIFQSLAHELIWKDSAS